MIGVVSSLILLTLLGQDESATYPLLESVDADLVVPAAQRSMVEPGKRVFYVPDGCPVEVPAVLWLPENWTADRTYPLFVELPGNGGYRDALGDECSGLPQDCHMGFGLTAGNDWIWLSLPFLNSDGTQLAKTWWGDPPDHRPDATIAYWQRAIVDVRKHYRADARCIVLAGFSRGAIACSAVALRDETLAQSVTAVLACSHFDGSRNWPFPDSQMTIARQRLLRLERKPVLICGESNQVTKTQATLEAHDVRLEDVTYLSTGFQNHSDEWTLRDCDARRVARSWLRRVGESSSVLKPMVKSE